MEYNDIEQQTLDILGRTDFKAIKKNELLGFTSMLNQMRPEVAKATLEQFPELAKLIHSSLMEYKGMLEKVVDSDDASVQQVYSAADKEMDDAAKGRAEFFQLAERIRADYSKCLDQEGLTAEQRKEILDREMEILEKADAKEKEVREQQEKTVKIASEKDSEKREFNWKLLSAASFVLVGALGVGAAVLGGKFDLKLPTKS